MSEPSEGFIIEVDEVISTYLSEYFCLPSPEWLSSECGITNKEAGDMLLFYNT